MRRVVVVLVAVVAGLALATVATQLGARHMHEKEQREETLRLLQSRAPIIRSAFRPEPQVPWHPDKIADDLAKLIARESWTDAWGNRLVFRYPGPVHKQGWDFYSIGPNGIDELGRGDDIRVGADFQDLPEAK